MILNPSSQPSPKGGKVVFGLLGIPISWQPHEAVQAQRERRC